MGGLGLQQEFTPTLDSLDSVELWIPQPILNPGGWYQAGSAALQLRDGVNGPVIATSEPFNNPPNYEGSAVFRFTQPVSVVPGHTYAIEPFGISGGGGGAYALPFQGNTGYDGGRLWWNGASFRAAI